jgi:hypothetical protein
MNFNGLFNVSKTFNPSPIRQLSRRLCLSIISIFRRNRRHLFPLKTYTHIKIYLVPTRECPSAKEHLLEAFPARADLSAVSQVPIWFETDGPQDYL